MSWLDWAIVCPEIKYRKTMNYNMLSQQKYAKVI